MTNQEDTHTHKRLTVTITNSNVDELEQLRSNWERRFKKRFSIAQVVKQLVTNALKSEF